MKKTILTLLFCASVFGSDYSDENPTVLAEQAQQALDDKADTTALELSEKACSLGSAEGCVIAGNIYRLGKSTERDNKKAITFFETASKLDSVTAKFLLGKMYYLGRGVPKDLNKAVSLFEKAALKGDLNSQSYLGFIYATAPKPIKNEKKSIAWFEKAKQNKDYKSFDIEDNTVQTVAGVLTVKTAEDDTSGWGKKSIYIDNDLKRERSDEFFQLTHKFSFDKSDVILVDSGCTGTSCVSENSLFIVTESGIIYETPRFGLPVYVTDSPYPPNPIITLFDGETFLTYSKDKSNNLNQVMYEDGEVAVNGEVLPRTRLYPLDLVESEGFKSKFENLLGSKYEIFKSYLTSAEETKFSAEGNYGEYDSITGQGWMAHAAQNRAIFVIKIGTYPTFNIKIYALMSNDGKVTKYGFKDWKEAPNELIEWAEKLGVKVKR